MQAFDIRAYSTWIVDTPVNPDVVIGINNDENVGILGLGLRNWGVRPIDVNAHFLDE